MLYGEIEPWYNQSPTSWQTSELHEWQGLQSTELRLILNKLQSNFMEERSTDDKSKCVMAQKSKAVGRDHLDEPGSSSCQCTPRK